MKLDRSEGTYLNVTMNGSTRGVGPNGNTAKKS